MSQVRFETPIDRFTPAAERDLDGKLFDSLEEGLDAQWKMIEKARAEEGVPAKFYYRGYFIYVDPELKPDKIIWLSSALDENGNIQHWEIDRIGTPASQEQN